MRNSELAYVGRDGRLQTVGGRAERVYARALGAGAQSTITVVSQEGASLTGLISALILIQWANLPPG